MYDPNEAQIEIREKIFTTFQIANLPTEEQEDVLSRISKVIFQSVLLRIVPFLDKTDIVEYEKLINEGATSEDLFKFFLDKAPQFLHIIKEETNTLAKNMLSNMPKAIKETKQETEIDLLREKIFNAYKN